MITFRKVDIELLAEYKLDLKDIISTGFSPSQKIQHVNLIHLLLFLYLLLRRSLLKPIDYTIKDGLITNIPVVYKDNTFNLLNEIDKQNKFLALRKNNVDKIKSFTPDYKFYQVAGSKPYVLCIKQQDSFMVDKIRYAMNGVLLTMVMDKMLQDGNILRKYNNYELLISEGKVIKI